MDSIDNRGDFKTYMQNYSVAFNSGAIGAGTISGRILRREGPWEEGFVSKSCPDFTISPNTAYSYPHYLLTCPNPRTPQHPPVPHKFRTRAGQLSVSI